MTGFETRHLGRTPLRVTVLGSVPELSAGIVFQSPETRQRRL